MKALWAPWRLQYVKDTSREDGCPFCEPGYSSSFCISHDQHAVVFMNRFPYANGHMMVMPARHTADLDSLNDSEVLALHHATLKVKKILDAWMHPHGYNVGLNIGTAAGAGIAAHLHQHIVPRWDGDVNFMPVLADVKIIPDHIEASAIEFRRRWEEL